MNARNSNLYSVLCVGINSDPYLKPEDKIGYLNDLYTLMIQINEVYGKLKLGISRSKRVEHIEQSNYVLNAIDGMHPHIPFTSEGIAKLCNRSKEFRENATTYWDLLQQIFKEVDYIDDMRNLRIAEHDMLEY